MSAATCGGDGGASDTADVEVRDSAGITIVDNAEVPSTMLGWSVSAAPEVDIGTAEGAEADQLYQVTGATRLSDSRIAVANGGTGELRIYDPAGRHLGSAGGPGGGPGEFQAMTLVGRLPGDSLLLYDARSLRFSVMSDEPAFARSFQPGSGGGAERITPRALLEGGPLAGTGVPLGEQTFETGVRNPIFPVLLVGLDGEVMTRVDSVPTRPAHLDIGEGVINVTTIPFASETQFAAGPDHLHIGTGDRYEIRTYSRAGDLVRLTRLDQPLEAVTDVQREAELERRLENAPEPARPGLRSRWPELPIPDRMPAYHKLEVDARGNLWVQEYRTEDGPQRWTVFDGEGRALGRIDLPKGLDVQEIGEDYVLAIALDEMEIEHVVLHRLDRGPTG